MTQGFWNRLAKWWQGPQQRLLAPDTRLLEVGGFAPAGFTCGIELLNDATTPMEFVVEVLETHARLPNKAAIDLMLRVHLEGGALVPLASDAEAAQAAAGIEAAARAKGHPLVCRAVRA